MSAIRAIRAGIFQALVVQGETFDDVFAQPLRGPDAEAGGDAGFDAVADGDDGIEIVKFRRVFLAVGGSSKEILYN